MSFAGRREMFRTRCFAVCALQTAFYFLIKRTGNQVKEYDIVIVGAGASGVFMSYELTKLDNDASILMLTKAPLWKKGSAPFPRAK